MFTQKKITISTKKIYREYKNGEISKETIETKETKTPDEEVFDKIDKAFKKVEEAIDEIFK